MLKHLVEIFGCVGLILGVMGFVFLESTYDPAFSPFSRAILLGPSCLVGTLLFVVLCGSIHSAFTNLISGRPPPWEDQ